MKVFIVGIDGYLGWSLALHLKTQGYTVGGVDNLLRRAMVAEVGSDSVLPILDIREREQLLGSPIYIADITEHGVIEHYLKAYQPDAIVHLGEQPSAPYSMIDAKHAAFTQQNNVIGTLNLLFAMRDICPDAHLVKLGTLGEYGTPNCHIPEGFFEYYEPCYSACEIEGPSSFRYVGTLPFPRQAPSFYHQSKVHDSHNIAFACKIWGLRSTDIMQGVVYGTRIDAMDDDDRLRTRFDYDGVFGTAINRFCAQVIAGHPITVYGKGKQVRGFLPLRDSMQCLTIAIANPPQKGEYRVFNQFADVYTIYDLAEIVREVADELSLSPEIKRLNNPRVEDEEHYYNPINEQLLQLGYEPTCDVRSEIELMLLDLIPHRYRIRDDLIIPDVRWDGRHKRSEWLGE